MACKMLSSKRQNYQPPFTPHTRVLKLSACTVLFMIVLMRVPARDLAPFCAVWFIVPKALACLAKLQLLCVHPSLVAGATAAPAEGGGNKRVTSTPRTDARLSGKLMALKELLWDAEIGERYCNHNCFVITEVHNK